MKIIALDSSGLTASVAIVEDDVTIAEYSVNYKKTHSQTLIPMLDEIRKMTECDLSTIDAIAIAKGPGSFTGLRIGSASAKGLGFALGVPIVEVSTTEALAYRFYGTDKIVCPMMDARRNQVYTGIYEFIYHNDPVLSTVLDASAMDVEEIICKINSLGRAVIFTGDGVPVYKEAITAQVKVEAFFAPSHLNRQSAATVGAVGIIKAKRGETVLPEAHVPEYLRLSQAERERNEAIHES